MLIPLASVLFAFVQNIKKGLATESAVGAGCGKEGGYNLPTGIDFVGKRKRKQKLLFQKKTVATQEIVMMF